MVADHEFFHNHRHSEFSPLDGTGNAIQYAERAAELGQQWLGLADHGTLGGALDHVRACRVEGDQDSEWRPGEKRSKDEAIIPIVGMEAFWVGGDPYGSRLSKDYDHNVKPHLVLQASGIAGWKNLIRIVTESNLTGFHGVPRVDLDLLERYGEGIVATTACLSSPVCRFLKEGYDDEAERFVRRLQDVLDGRVWVSIMGHDVDDQRLVNPGLVNIAYRTGSGLVVESDAHYPIKKWGDTQEIVFMMSRRETFKARAEKEEAARVSGDEVYGKNLGSAYIMSAREMLDLFEENHPGVPREVVEEGMRNTVEMARTMRPYVVDRDLKMPRASNDPAEAERVVREWCEEAFERERRRRPNFADLEPRYREQLEFELDTLRDKDAIDYFYMLGGEVRKAREGRIKRHPGKVVKGRARGSAAGALLAYLLNITNVDPIAYGLLFERFLNPDREGMPDIDMDWPASDPSEGIVGREEMIQELADEYGEEFVAHVITYQTFGPRASIEEIGKVFNDGDEVVDFRDRQNVKEQFGNLDKHLVKLRKKLPDLDAFARRYPRAWTHMERVDNMVKAPSKHASAIVVADRPITEYAPLKRSRGRRQDGSEDKMVVEWADRAEFPAISLFGLIKYDYLGLDELTKHEYALRMIEEREGERPDFDEMPIMWDPDAGEPEVFEAFGRGLTLGVFQFGGQGITKLIRAIKPDSILDLVAANAMYRPGPMELSFRYAKRKRGEEEVDYPHDLVVPFLEETYGLPAYQEQIMQMCKAIGDFTPGEADSMRKAMSKLYRIPGDRAQEFMAGFRDQWVRGCKNHGVADEVRDRIWENFLSWGDYGFNKAHSLMYAVLAYTDMWLKVHHPHEFYSALLTYPKDLSTSDILREARVMGVEILPPDANESARGFTIAEDGLRYGLLAIKNIGGAAAHDIIEGRPYENFEDFASRRGAGDAMNLLRAGAFDATDDRLRLLSVVPKTDEPIYDVTLTCGCLKRGMKFDPRDPYKRDDDGEVVRFKSGKRAGEPKTKGKLPYCKDHDADAIEEVQERQETWTVAQAIAHNAGLVNPRPTPEGGVVPSSREVSSAEKDALNGVALSAASVVVDHVDFIEARIYTQDEFERMEDRERLTVAGEVVDKRVVKIKNGRDAGRDMCFFEVQYGENRWSCTLFADAYLENKDLLDANAVMVYGRKDTWKDSVSVIVEEMADLEELVKEDGDGQ